MSLRRRKLVFFSATKRNYRGAEILSQITKHKNQGKIKGLNLRFDMQACEF